MGDRCEFVVILASVLTMILSRGKSQIYPHPPTSGSVSCLYLTQVKRLIGGTTNTRVEQIKSCDC